MPDMRNEGWARNVLDRYLGVVHEQQGLTPSPEATRNLLLRRLYLDLIGLLPTRQQLREFLDDDSPAAYERVVDRLLSSPQ